MRFLIVIAVAALTAAPSLATPAQQPGHAKPKAEKPVEIVAGEWILKGDFRKGRGSAPRPAVLLLNKANGNRQAYVALAEELARRGISSFRLDLRGHGDSVNAGRFIPFDNANNEKIFTNQHVDLIQALAWLRANPSVDSARLGVVGASYSGEFAMDAARREGRYLQAYALLSPGSLSEESARSMDLSGARWMFIRAAREQSRSVAAAADLVQAHAKKATVRVVDSDKHATDLLAEPLGLNAALAEWFEQILGR